MNTGCAAARLPPTDLAGLEPSWSTLVSAVDGSSAERTWHVLDTAVPSPRGTVLCVHGNPNWSYMWRDLARRLTDWRVIAVDALNMGFSERTGEKRRLADHIADLETVTRALDIDGPVVVVAHDWGGPIAVGWARAEANRLAGMVLMNTGVARPPGVRVPPLISMARAALRPTCETTPVFLHGALRMARPRLERPVYRGYTAPYDSAARRTGIADFVDDIPIDEGHESYATLASVAAGLDELQHVPALLLWGAKDIIFSDAFLHDLMHRLPHADVHRYADAGHQVIEDSDAVDVIATWLEQDRSVTESEPSPGARAGRRPIWSAIEARREDPSVAIVEGASSISFAELDQRIRMTARRLGAAGVGAGDRLATLVPPGIDLTVLVYACLRAGVVVVAPDAALGIDGMRRALRSSRPDFVVGDWRGLLLARALRLPATRLHPDRLGLAGRDSESDAPESAEPAPQDPAAIVFTSGSTGPSKGVVYTHGRLEAQRDALATAFAIEPTDRLVVAFAPFAVLAPAIGIPVVIPEMDVTAPAELHAEALADAALAIDATVVFASPAVLANVASTSNALGAEARSALQRIRLVATAGAPVSPQLLGAIEEVFPDARFATPYGMTEVLPVTLASADEIRADEIRADTTSAAHGVCVGRPLPGVELWIDPIDGELGEICIEAEHMCAGYDRLWARQHHAFADGRHRSGDVGHIDAHGRLWIEGRIEHLIHAPDGVLAPVGIELQAESVAGVTLAAAVGIGPAGTQQLAVVVAGPSLETAVVADPTLAAEVRAAVEPAVAAVLVAPRIPVDRRHNSKIDRSRVQRWADAVLRGDRPPKL